MNTQFEELRLTGRLPSPTPIGVRLLQLLNDEDCDIAHLAHTLQTDPALSGRLLKLANSGRYRGSAAVTSISEAVVRLGGPTVRNLALGFSVLPTERGGHCETFDHQRYWLESLARAIAAERFAEELGTASPSDAYTAGLLAGIGRLALASVHPNTYATVLSHPGLDSEVKLADVEQDLLAIHHGEVAYYLLRDWHLPELLCRAVSDYWRPPSRTHTMPAEYRAMCDILSIANSFARIVVESEKDRHQRWHEFELNRIWLSLTHDEACGLGDRISFQWREWANILGIAVGEITPFQTIADRGLDYDVYDGAHLDRGEGAPPASIREPPPFTDERIVRVLIAHSDLDVRSRWIGRLLLEGFDVVTAQSGTDALTLALDSGPDILLIDHALPRLGGFEVCRQLRVTEVGKTMHMVAIVDDHDPAWNRLAIEAGVSDVIPRHDSDEYVWMRLKLGEQICRLQRTADLSNRRRRHAQVKVTRLERELAIAATTDPLTSLRSQTFAIESLYRTWERTPSSPLSIALFAVESVEQVNLAKGREAGDQLLAEVALRMSNHKRRGDLMCRLGGRVFAILCRNKPEGALAMGERFRELVAVGNYRTALADHPVTTTVGIATRTSAMATPGDLLREAERALHLARERGGNRTVTAEEFSHLSSDRPWNDSPTRPISERSN